MDARGKGSDKGGQGKGQGRESLDELFWEWQMEEGLPLEEFLDQVAAGRFGNRDRRRIAEFIEGVAQSIMSNIDTKASEGPAYQAMREDVIEETRERFNALLEKYAPREGKGEANKEE